MRRIKMMGLCLVAVCALAAVAVSSASAALPEFKVCVKAEKVGKAYNGKYADKECSVAEPKGEGKYELKGWEAAKKFGVKGKNGVSTLDSYIPENEAEPWKGGTVAGVVSCKSGKSEGEITGPKTTSITVEFKTCTSEGHKCTSPGQKAGVIKTRPLIATLGYINKAEKTVGSDVEAADHGASAEFSCEVLEIQTVGSVIGVNSGDVNKISNEGTQTFKVNSKGGQEVVFGEFPENPTTGSAHFLLSHITPPGVTLPSGENTTSVLKGEKEMIAA
jgi:hypothetical protein